MKGRRPARQRGMSGSGWFLLIVVVLGSASVGLRLIPHYTQHSTVDGQIRALLDRPEMSGMGRNEVHERLKTNLKLNNVRDFDTRDKLTMEITAGVVKMDLFYEVREPLFWNVDVILTFEEHYEKVL